MNQINNLDTVDCIDEINAKLEQAEGILCALEISLSTSDIHHHKLPHAVTAAMGFIEESKGLVKVLCAIKDDELSQGDLATH